MGTTTSSFGAWVRRRRLALDLTQSALARHAGCSASTVKKIELGERMPSRGMVQSLADALGIPPGQRDRFVAAGLGELAPDRLESPTVDGGPAPVWISRAAPRPTTEVVGRDGEVERLRQHLDVARGGNGRTIFVTGEAGHGKTTLLSAFAERALEAVPDLVVARGAGAAATGSGDPYMVIRDVFRMLLADSTPPAQADLVTARQAHRLWESAPLVARSIHDVGPRLVGTVARPATVWQRLGLTAPRTQLAAGTDHLSDEITDVLRLVADECPLLLLLDDMQWADTASAELLFQLTRRLGASRVLVLCAYRDSEVTGGARPATEALRKAVFEASAQLDEPRIDLARLGADGERRLCDALIDTAAPGLDREVRDALYERTHGHPLFVLELLRNLTTNGHIERRPDGAWAAREVLSWDELPGRVAAMIDQRIGRLSAPERALMEAAAVEGEHFLAENAADVAGIEPHSAYRLLSDRLDRIHDLLRGPVTERTAGDVTTTRYRFSHQLFAQYVYDRLDSATRRSMHGQLARVLERSGRAGDAQLAHHYAEAGDGARAVPYLIAVGDRARMLHAHDEAISAYRRAVGLLRELGDKSRLASTMMKMGVTYESNFDHPSAQCAFDEAFELWPVAIEEPDRDVSHAQATLRMVSPEPTSLDPVVGGDSIAILLAHSLFSGLVRYDEDSNVVPDIASRWTISPDGRRYEFQLRDDVTWSDGEPVTAGDFAYTYRRALDEDAPWDRLPRDLLAAIAYRDGEPAVSAPDDHLLVIELAQPVSYFLYNLIHDVLMPVPRHVVEREGESWWRPEMIVTNGPFIVDGWKAGVRLTLTRNPKYHGRGLGNVRRVEIRFHPIGSTEPIHLYVSGQVDVLDTDDDVIYKLARRFPAEHKRLPASLVLYYSVDPDGAVFADRRLREAMALAFDRDLLLHDRLRDLATAATGGMVPPGLPGHVRDLAPASDPVRAAQLLRQALDGSPPPNITIVALTSFATVAERLASSWRSIGFGVKVQLPDTFVEVKRMMAEAGDAGVAVMAWGADYPDPDTVLRVCVTSALPRWRHPRFHALIDAATRATDSADRHAAYEMAERVLTQEHVIVPLGYAPNHYMIKPWVLRFPSVPFPYTGFWQDVIIDPARAESAASAAEGSARLQSGRNGGLVGGSTG